ncbi:glycoside hydrolase family 2 TIM barrel-domain containing protein [Paenibacillus sp. YN15]|uniref:glycoside hydrolase family 2 TIM barrel-domain containing protein n=1 Tax=Paenibacillus sp. YN15 TaxID=1742774 RepID=UPI000DCE7D05|nr:glycoside hydrolase family 2 TIM barrel-domain containing protein [Paenibacillus sp. YN15]RAU91588.1 glycoside hydrolase family 2 [Paenibacillus sp. YN15]
MKRRSIAFYENWRFAKGEQSGAEAPEFDDSGWQPVILPHDWSIEGPFDEHMEGGTRNGFLPLGVGWYRKRFTPPALDPEQERLWIEFDGVYRESDVWLNGCHLGTHTNGYLGFRYDLTPHLRREGPNVLAVRCDNETPLTSRWYTGSGIYRQVRLKRSGRLHIPMNGVFVSTPLVELGQAAVRVEAEAAHDGAASRLGRLQVEIVDPEGRPVASAAACAPVGPGAVHRFVTELRLPFPRLWEPDTPELYRAVVSLGDEAGEQDCCETAFGIRRMEFSAEQGFLLNGRKLFLKGVNLHHDYGCLGAASLPRAMERRLAAVKELGANAVRLSHNPHDPALLELCDRLGLLVYNEAFDKLTGQFNGYRAPFEETWQKDLAAFLRRDRNHPSVFLWGVGNEPVDAQIHSPDKGVGLVGRMADFVRAYDSARLAACALYPSRAGGVRPKEAGYGASEPPELAFAAGVAGYNYTQGFFGGDHEKYPQLRFILSEAAVNGELGGWFDYSQDFVAGHFFWGGTDYLGESFGWPNKGWFKGLIDLCGQRKPFSYYVEAVYSKRPMVHIAVYDPSPASSIYWNDVELSWRGMESHWSWLGCRTVQLATYTNCPEVELRLNGRSLGLRRLADCPRMLMEWEVPYEPGTLEAVGYQDGGIAAVHRLETTGPAEGLLLLPDRELLAADGQDLCHVRVMAVDREGRTVPGVQPEVRFRVAGAASNAGVCSADMLSGESFRGDHRTLCKGEGLIILRSTLSPGDITVEAEAVSLKPARLFLQSVHPPDAAE